MNTAQLLLEATTSGHVTVKKNNVYFHSRHNPIEEAKSYAENFFQKYKNEKHILMLGVGIGYHLTAIFELFASNGINPPQIVALDPNQEILEFIQNHNIELLKNKNLRILTDNDLSYYFKNFEFMKFLSERPRTLSWHGAYQADSSWYESFLKFKALNKLSDVIEHSNCTYAKNTLNNIATNTNTDLNIKEYMKLNHLVSAENYLLRALLEFRSNEK
jgi:hypothetical protein